MPTPDAPSPTPPTIVDLRTQKEKDLADRMSDYFSNLLGQPDFGFSSDESALDPLYKRQEEAYKEGVYGASADAGFGPLRQGPATSQISRGLQEMGENRTAGTVARKDAWRQFVLSGGRASTQPVGRQAVSPSYPPQQSNPWAQLGGGLLGSVIGGGGWFN